MTCRRLTTVEDCKAYHHFNLFLSNFGTVESDIGWDFGDPPAGTRCQSPTSLHSLPPKTLSQPFVVVGPQSLPEEACSLEACCIGSAGRLQDDRLVTKSSRTALERRKADSKGFCNFEWALPVPESFGGGFEGFPFDAVCRLGEGSGGGEESVFIVFHGVSIPAVGTFLESDCDETHLPRCSAVTHES